MIVYCVNDGAVMNAWASDQGVDQGPDGLVTMMGDPSGSLTRSLGMVLNHPGPMAVLGYERCKRFALVIDNGVVAHVATDDDGAEVSHASNAPPGAVPAADLSNCVRSCPIPTPPR